MSKKLILKGLPLGARATKIYKSISELSAPAPNKIYVKDFQKMSVAYLEYDSKYNLPLILDQLGNLTYCSDDLIEFDSYIYKVRCEMAFDKPQKVFLGNLPFDVKSSEIDILTHFIATALGLSIHDLKIEPVQWPDGRCKGFGFLMTEEINAKRILELDIQVRVRDRIVIIKPASTEK